MSSTSSRVRAVVFAAILALVPASSVVAQSHKGHHAQKAQQAAPAARPAQAAATQPHAAPMHAAYAAPNDAYDSKPRPSDQSLISSLHSTMTHLNQAEHDYNGHRAQAMLEINTAIKLLSPSPGRSNAVNRAGSGQANGTNTAPRQGNGPRIPRAISDAHLGDAQQALMTLESRMDISGMNPHNYILAKKSVQSALRELNLALVDR